MDLHIQGKVVEILEEQSGEGRNGPWRRRDFIMETDDRYPRKVCVSQWGDSIDTDSVSPGETVKAYINLQSREFNGRWYTDVRAWRIDREGAEASGDSNDSQYTESDDTEKASSGSPMSDKPRSGPFSSQDSSRKDTGLQDNTLDDVDDDLPF